MPRRTGRQIAAQSASIAKAIPCAIMARFRRPEILHTDQKIRAACWPPEWGRYRIQTLPNNRNPCLAGLTRPLALQNDGPDSQADRYRRHDAEERNPHGGASSMAPKARGSLAVETRENRGGSWPPCQFLRW